MPAPESLPPWTEQLPGTSGSDKLTSQVAKQADPKPLLEKASAPSARPLVLAITGASGAPYAVRLIEVLSRADRQVHLVLSRAGAEVLREEVGIDADPDGFDTGRFLAAALASRPFAEESLQQSTLCAPEPQWLHYQHYMDWSAGIASGSFLTAGMVICPCSMSTLAAIAGGLSTNLIQRAADVHLKERRKLILVPRETPLNVIHLENMTKCASAGAIVLPAMPGFYHQPKSAEDLVDFVVGRICDQLGVEHRLFARWGSP